MSEILVQIREQSIEAMHEGDIKALYTLVETYHEELTEEMEQGLYNNILELALELLTNALETQSTLSLDDEQQRYTLRALYEYAISHYSSERFEEAKALFEVLEGMGENENFCEAMAIHAAASQSQINIDRFLDQYCEAIEKLDDFYINAFKKEARELLEKYKESKAENASAKDSK